MRYERRQWCCGNKTISFPQHPYLVGTGKYLERARQYLPTLTQDPYLGRNICCGNNPLSFTLNSDPYDDHMIPFYVPFACTSYYFVPTRSKSCVRTLISIHARKYLLTFGSRTLRNKKLNCLVHTRFINWFFQGFRGFIFASGVGVALLDITTHWRRKYCWRKENTLPLLFVW